MASGARTDEDSVPLMTLKTYERWYQRYTGMYGALTEVLMDRYNGVEPTEKYFWRLTWNKAFPWAFGKHKSQLVWYRFLWLIFSRYAFFNALVDAGRFPLMAY
jgi:hypothetical protein